MIRSKWTALTIVGLLSISSLAAFAQSTGRDAPVDKGGMPPYSEMNAGTSDGKALLPDTLGGGNGGDTNGRSIDSGKRSGSVSGGSSMGSGSGSGSGGSGGSGSIGTDRTDDSAGG
ncbi:hypothetical protein LOY36_19375 [Pseudomonas sp. B21-019]|nr:hypothetical protein [Pseudomonas sp. B21-019]UVM31336.1 hypothetical protein LOY36_19375 [Pseudomonas sp. B21-019]